MKSVQKKTAGVILAAGSASRMGKTKQLMSFGHTTLLGQVFQNAARSALSPLIVVLGHDATKIQQTIDLSSAAVVINPAYAKGQSTSLIAGLEHVPPACDAAMFLLGDQPLISPEIINTLIHAFQASTAPIVIPFFNGRRGNPVIIARSLFHRLRTVSADTGARVLFREFKTSILKVPLQDDAILVDVDTMIDYEKLMSKKMI